LGSARTVNFKQRVRVTQQLDSALPGAPAVLSARVWRLVSRTRSLAGARAPYPRLLSALALSNRKARSEDPAGLRSWASSYHRWPGMQVAGVPGSTLTCDRHVAAARGVCPDERAGTGDQLQC
jgi:hypothetical protein